MTHFFAIGLLALGGFAPVAASSSVVGVIGVSEGGPCSEDGPILPGLGGPFGFFDGKATDGGTAGGGVLPLQGWALADSGVQRVIIQIDGIDFGTANLQRVRSDVTALFPGFPDSGLPGWEFQLDTTRWPNGLHAVQPVVVANDGQARPLNVRTFQFTNLSHTLRPFGQINTPNPNADVFGLCGDPLNPDRRQTVISGWAADLGVETNDQGIGWVELLIDGAIVRNTRLNCQHSTTTGMFTDCYGLPRLDIERQFPFVFDAPAAGFRFVIDVGQLIDSGYAEGRHNITIRAGDIDSQIENIDVIGLNFICHDPVLNEGSLGEIDELPSKHHGGVINFTGWALDAERVERVRLYVDGVYVGDATRGFPRPEITSLYPGFPYIGGPGWAFSFDSRGLTDGPHQLQVFVVDGEGQRFLIGEIEFETRN